MHLLSAENRFHKEENDIAGMQAVQWINRASMCNMSVNELKVRVRNISRQRLRA